MGLPLTERAFNDGFAWAYNSDRCWGQWELLNADICADDSEEFVAWISEGTLPEGFQAPLPILKTMAPELAKAYLFVPGQREAADEYMQSIPPCVLAQANESMPDNLKGSEGAELYRYRFIEGVREWLDVAR